MRKEYTIKELQEIFGCSRTAIVKKIKTSGDNTDIRRYKDRYEVSQKDGQMVILFEDWELEEEKRLSRGMGLVSNNSDNTDKNADIIDVEPEKENLQDNVLLDFTNRYIERFTTLQETMYNELRERDKQIMLLTTAENNKQTEYLRTSAENKMLKKRNTVLTVLLGVLITVLLCVITWCITSMTVINDTNNPDMQKEPVQQEIVKNPAKPVKNSR